MKPSDSTRSPRGRRALLAEGRTLLHYVADQPPDRWALRHYVRALESRIEGAEPIALAPWIRRFPRLLAWRDETAFAASGDDTGGLRDPSSLTGRLYLAFAVAETRPALADAFLPQNVSRFGIFVSLLRASVFEGFPLAAAWARSLRSRTRVKPER